jgi:ATP-dependent Clp protease protease subunit
MDWRLYWGKLVPFVYKEHEQILQKTISDVKEKLNIDFVETFFGYNKVYKFKDFSLSYLSSTSYSQHLDGICDINFNSKELYVICPVVLRYGLYVEENDEKDEKSKAPEPQSSEIAKALYKSRTILIFGEVDMKMAERVTAQLLAYAESEGDIRVIVNSPGGHVESGDTIHDMIRFVGNRVKMIGTGWVASAGAHIFLGAKHENRFCLPFTRFLLHQPLGGVRGQASDIQIRAKEVLHNKHTMLEMLAVNTGKSVEQLSKDSDRMTYLTAEEAKEYGLIDRVLTSQKELPNAALVDPGRSPSGIG